MQATIICDKSSDNVLANFMNTTIHGHLSEIQTISWYDVHKDDIRPCIGCFNCWIKTPGKCIMNDITTIIYKDMINSDLFICTTPLLYGSYSVTIKRVLDHLIPILLPFFTMSHGEVHHKQRYAKRPKMIIVAYNESISDDEKQTFIALARANALNLNINDPEIYFCTNEKDAIETATKIKKYFAKDNTGGLSS